jgi:hypothetical protein
MKRVIIASKTDDFIYVILRNGDPIAKGSYEAMSKKSVNMTVPTDIKKFSKSKFNSYLKMAKEARRPNPLKFAVNRYINDNREEFREINSATYMDGFSTAIECFNIDWDTDGEDASVLGLPESVIINNPTEEMINDLDGYGDSISDYLSDEYGYLVKGFSVEPIIASTSIKASSSVDTVRVMAGYYEILIYVGDVLVYALDGDCIETWYDYEDKTDCAAQYVDAILEEFKENESWDKYELVEENKKEIIEALADYMIYCVE